MATNKKTVVSVRIDSRTVENWKAYATASGFSMPELITKSITEYMADHPLSGYRQHIFEAKKGMIPTTVREWITEAVKKAVTFEIERSNAKDILPEHEVQEYIDYLVDDCCEGWEGTDNIYDDENKFWRDRTIDYVERRTEEDIPDAIEKHEMEMED